MLKQLPIATMDSDEAHVNFRLAGFSLCLVGLAFMFAFSQPHAGGPKQKQSADVSLSFR